MRGGSARIGRGSVPESKIKQNSGDDEGDGECGPPVPAVNVGRDRARLRRVLHGGARTAPDYHGLEVARAFADVLKLYIRINNFSVVNIRLNVHNIAANAGAYFALRG